MRYSLNVAHKVQTHAGIRLSHYCRIDIPDTREADALEKARQLETVFNPSNKTRSEHEFVVELTRWEEHGVNVPLYPK